MEYGRAVFTPDPVEFTRFKQSPDGVVGSWLRGRAHRLELLAKASVPKHHGALAASINSRFYSARNPYVVVGSQLNYAYYVHEGTRPHIILPHHGRMLRFVVHGKVVYAHKVVHPGTRPTRFLTRHLREVVK